MALPARDTVPILARPVTTPVQYSKWSPRAKMNSPVRNDFSTIPARAMAISRSFSPRDQAAMRLRESSAIIFVDRCPFAQSRPALLLRWSNGALLRGEHGTSAKICPTYCQAQDISNYRFVLWRAIVERLWRKASLVQWP